MRGREKENLKLEDQVFSPLSPLSSCRFWMRVARRIVLATLISFFPLASPAKGQDNATPAQLAKRARQSPASTRAAKRSHPFWDKGNIVLFAGLGAGRALDYTSTRHFRTRGVDEWLLTNDTVDNKPLFAGLEVAGAAASIGVSYLFHRSGHHKLERWVSIIHIGAAVGGSAWNYTLKAPPPAGAAH